MYYFYFSQLLRNLNSLITPARKNLADLVQKFMNHSGYVDR